MYLLKVKKYFQQKEENNGHDNIQDFNIRYDIEHSIYKSIMLFNIIFKSKMWRLEILKLVDRH